MAKQAGPFFFTGTIGDVIFYKLGDQYLIRMKGDYNKKRMQKPGAYPLMQLRQQEFGQASKLASIVYRLLPRAEKKHGLFGQLTKAARQLLKEGKTHEEVIIQLKKKYRKEPAPIKANEEVGSSCLLAGATFLRACAPDTASSLLNDSQVLHESITYAAKHYATYSIE